MDWRVVLGMGLTAVWITAGLVYLLSIVGWNNFVTLPTADIGSFLEGAFAPLAFLWLVIGHFMQQKEITANTKAIGIQEKSARRLEVHSQRDSYFKLLDLVQEQLGSVASFHYMSVLGPTGSGQVSSAEFTEQRNHASNGDPAWFVRKMISLAMANRDDSHMLQEIFFGTDIRSRHTNNFVTTFAKLENAARAVDQDDMVTDALMFGSASGMLYRIILTVRGDECIESLVGLNEPSAPDTAGTDGAEAATPD